MATALEDRIQRAIRDGRAARSAYYATIDLPDEQQLGPPAAPARLADLEAGIGRPLPPSYRTFLRLHDGWRMINGSSDLLSIDEMLGGSTAEKIRVWRERMKKYGEDVAARCLVIGMSDVTPTKFLLDPETVDANGEWALVRFHKEVEEEYPSFIDWLEASVGDFRQLAENPPE